MKNIIVAFHVGRGGRFNNGGYKTFNPNIQSLQDCFGDAMIIDTDPETDEQLPDNEWLLIDSGGNEILHGREEIESKTGVLDWDTIYDTDIVRNIEDCTEEELQLIYEAVTNGDWVEPDVKEWITEYAKEANW